MELSICYSAHELTDCSLQGPVNFPKTFHIHLRFVFRSNVFVKYIKQSWVLFRWFLELAYPRFFSKEVRNAVIGFSISKPGCVAKFAQSSSRVILLQTTGLRTFLIAKASRLFPSTWCKHERLGEETRREVPGLETLWGSAFAISGSLGSGQWDGSWKICNEFSHVKSERVGGLEDRGVGKADVNLTAIVINGGDNFACDGYLEVRRAKGKLGTLEILKFWAFEVWGDGREEY